MANGEQVLGRILTGGATGAVEGLEARERAEDRALLRGFQGRQLDIQERNILLREQQAQAELDRSNKINELSQGIVDSQNLLNRTGRFNRVLKTLGNRDLAETSPEEQRQLVEMISALRRGGSGIAITSEGIMVPFEEDEEGNPVFIDIATMRQAVENARNTIAANRVKLETLDPSIDLSRLLQTERPGRFRQNVVSEGVVSVLDTATGQTTTIDLTPNEAGLLNDGKPIIRSVTRRNEFNETETVNVQVVRDPRNPTELIQVELPTLTDEEFRRLQEGQRRNEIPLLDEARDFFNRRVREDIDSSIEGIR